jgi:thioesterase domain-containing protein/acyl carrier protein
LLPTLPLTPNGKIDRRALPQPDQAQLELRRSFVAPRNALERQLSQLWETLLGVQSISIKDNFFELGGHSLLAVRLLAHVEKLWGKKLPLATFFQTQTIEQLANLLSQEHWSASWSSLVAIQPGGSKPPFFCVHGATGQVLGFRSLAAYLGQDQPFYGLQAQGLGGQQLHTSRVEDMAAHYLKEIQALQPEGPYFLGGFCLGGKIAFEMAQRLHAQGQNVALLALFDTYGPGFPRVLSLGKRIANLRRNLSRLTLYEKLVYIRARAGEKNPIIKRVLRRAISRVYLRLGRPVPRALQDVSDANFQAADNYMPRRYLGRVTLFTASELAAGSDDDPQGGWGPLAAGGVEVQVVVGSHEMMHEPQVRMLADKLKVCLQKAQTILPDRLTRAWSVEVESGGKGYQAMSASGSL